jgi:hypothetical protein
LAYLNFLRFQLGFFPDQTGRLRTRRRLYVKCQIPAIHRYGYPGNKTGGFGAG